METARNAAQDFFDLGTDALEMASAFCRTNNLEIFVSIRVNDQHDATSSPRRGYNALFPRFKKEHPECLMGAFGSSNTNLYRQCRCNWSCVNFACGLVRDAMRRFVREFLENYDVDGVEFDFNRHCVLFKSVAEGGVASSTERELMTEAQASGVDGIYVFNREGDFLRKIAQLDPSPANMSDKTYFVRYRGSGGYTPERWLKGGSRHDRLPKIDPASAHESDFPTYRPGSRVSFDLMVGDHECHSLTFGLTFLRTTRLLGHNLVWMAKNLGKAIPAPEQPGARTNFIR